MEIKHWDGHYLRGSSCATQSPNKWSKVCAVVGARDNQVGHRKVGKFGQDIVQGHERASSGCSIVVPDVAVVGIGANGGRSSRYEAVDGVTDEEGFVGKG